MSHRHFLGSRLLIFVLLPLVLFAATLRSEVPGEIPPGVIDPATILEPSAVEQAVLEWVNRTRTQPGVEAECLDLDLNTGLPADTLDAQPRPPLAFDPRLSAAAGQAGQDGLAQPLAARLTAAGFPLDDLLALGEATASASATEANARLSLVQDALFLQPEARQTLLDPNFSLFGADLTENTDTALFTAVFAARDAEALPLLTGVVYGDDNANNRYDPGEGLGNIIVRLGADGTETHTQSAGGYALPYSGGGWQEVIFSGLPLVAPVRHDFFGTGDNVKLDLALPLPNASPTLTASVAGAGTLTSAPVGLSCAPDCTAQFPRDTTLTLTATPASDFLAWSGACSGSEPSCTLTLDQSHHVLARFQSDPAGAKSGQNPGQTTFIIA